ncbi:MAG: TRAP transporter large permease, partial [Desulfobacterales bacterium]|nr:TRAP transporter large permease [Desulfobacterales bacterium]
LTTIPLFTLAGFLMERGGMSDQLINISRKLVGAYRGGLGLVTVVACMFFAALSGSGPATTAAIGSITIPSMLDEEYKPRFAGAIAAAAGALGSLIPPSNLLIIYGLVAEQSIPKLFLAGIVPGLMIGFLLMIFVAFIARKNNYGGDGEKVSLRPLLEAMWEGKWALGAPLIILGGIYSGIVTPSEAAAIAVFYALFVGFFIYKGLTLKKLIKACEESILMIGTVLFILGSTKAFGQLVTLYDIPESIAMIFSAVTENPTLVLLMIGGFYILIGTWMDSIPQIIIFTAVFLPFTNQLGIDPILFGIVTVMTCEVGFLTPPIGANLFVASKISKVSIEEISVGILPLLLPYVIMFLLIVVLPFWVLFLPNLCYGTGM